MKLYREVKASERLPEKNGEYIVHLVEGLGLDVKNYWLSYTPEGPIEAYYSDEAEIDDWENTVSTWLEPIEITEGEIEEFINECEEAYGRPASLAVEIGISWIMDKLN